MGLSNSNAPEPARPRRFSGGDPQAAGPGEAVDHGCRLEDVTHAGTQMDEYALVFFRHLRFLYFSLFLDADFQD